MVINHNIDTLKETYKKLKSVATKTNSNAVFGMIMDNASLQEIDIQGKLIYFICDSEFDKSIIINEYYDQLQTLLNEIMNSNFKMVVMDEEEYKKLKANKTSTVEKKIIIQESIDSVPNLSLNKDYTFENFVVSPKNRHIVTASAAIAIEPGKKWNPMFIYGGSGLGKTHLLHAIGNAVWEKDKSKRIKYMPASDLSNLINKATISSDKNNAFFELIDEFDKYDVLLIDDIQSIGTREKAKDIFFSIFNSFISDKKQIVIASDSYPTELQHFEERFLTRFDSGLTLTIYPPDVNSAKEILKMKIKLKHKDFDASFITDEAYEFICQNFSSNVRSLEGALARLVISYIDSDGRQTITLNDVKEIFGNIKTDRKITIKGIISIVSKYYQIPEVAITGASRKAEVVLARHVAVYLSRTLGDFSLKQIANEFKRDHSTIISSIDKITNEKDGDKELSQAIYNLTGKIMSKK